MEALSFTVLVPHSGVGVAAVGCVEDVDSPSSLLCFAMLSSSSVFCSPCQRCSCLSAVASCRCCWWQGRERLAVVRRGPASASLYLLLLHPAFWLWFVHSPLSLSLSFSFFSLLFSSIPPLSFSLLSSLSPSLCSVPPLAFIARGCMRYYRNIVTVGVHHGGEGYQLWNVPHNRSNLGFCCWNGSQPLLPKRVLKEIVNGVQDNGTILTFKMNISDYFFCNFVIKPPDKL